MQIRHVVELFLQTQGANNSSMKRFILISFLVLAGFVGINAQTASPSPTPTPPNVMVSQAFVDSASKAFDLVVAQRDQIAQLLNERSMNATERAAWVNVKASLDAVIAVHANIEDAYKQLDAVKDKIIKIQDDMISKLYAQINKKPSFFEKLITVLEKATLILAGVALGHGL